MGDERSENTSDLTNLFLFFLGFQSSDRLKEMIANTVLIEL